jgi:hypothetical protein
MGINCPRCNLEGDYIPGGKPVDEVVNVRQVPSGHFARCGCAIGDDPQSGPIYCGDKAE